MANADLNNQLTASTLGLLLELRRRAGTDPLRLAHVLKLVPREFRPFLEPGWKLIPPGRRLCTRCGERTTTPGQRWCPSCRRGPGPRPFPRPALYPKGARLIRP